MKIMELVVKSKASGRITAKQKLWQGIVAGLGSIISGDDAVIHHAVGVTGKHNKVAIGPWWIIPLTNEEHLALHAGDSFGFHSRKEFEKDAFTQVCQLLHPTDYITEEVEKAIEGYHR